MHQTATAILFGLLFSCSLAGCGEGDQTETKGPAPIPAVGGAETPEALLTRVRAASDKQDLTELFACIQTEHRAGMAYFMGVGPIQMMIGVAEMLTGVGQGDQASEMKAKVSIMKEKHAALLAKYDVPMIKQGDRVMQDKTQAERLAVLNSQMDGVDLVGFVTEALAIIEEHATKGQKEAGGPFEEMRKRATTPVKEMTRRGNDEVAVVFDKEDTPPMLLRRVDGRWYLTLEQ